MLTHEQPALPKDLPACPSWRLIKRHAHRKAGALTGFRQGWFVMIKPVAAYAIKLWPEAQIWVAEDGQGWRRSRERERHLLWFKNIGRQHDPAESVRRMGDGAWADREGQLLLTAIEGGRVQAYWQLLHHNRLLATLPEPTRRIIQVIQPRDGFWVLEFMLASRYALELICSNPGLGFLLATARRLDPALPLVGAVALAQRPQRQILAALGLPPSEHLRLFLMRLDFGSLHSDSLMALRSIVGLPGAFDLLAQVERLNPDVIRWLQRREFWRYYTPRLIADVGSFKDPEILDMNITGMCGLQLLDEAAALGFWKPRPLKSLGHYRGQVHELRELLGSPSLALPEPPCAGDETIVPLLSGAALIAEGEAMHHCLGKTGHLLDVLCGRLHFYRVTAPQRGTLELVRAGNDKWTLGQLMLAHNEEPCLATLIAVERKLGEWLGERFRPQARMKTAVEDWRLPNGRPRLAG
jgi:hypothetical protein